MKRTSILIIALLVTLYYGSVNAKCFEPDSILSKDQRTIFVSLGSGFPEFLTIRLGYQIDNGWSTSVKVSDYYNGAGGRMYLGTLLWGVKLTRYYEPFLLSINNISAELAFCKSGNYNNYAFDISIGNETTRNLLIKPYWAVNISLIKTFDNKLYLTPGAKLGINLNF